LRALINAAPANPGRALRLRASVEIVHWLAGAGRDSRAEAESRLGRAFEIEVAADFRREQFDVVAL
jgi:hypothetical protein